MESTPSLTDTAQRPVADFIPSIGLGRGVSVRLDLVCRDKDGKITSTFSNEFDQTVKQFAQAIQNQMLASTVSGNMTDTGGTSRAVSAGSAGSSPNIHFGIGTTASAFTDTKIQTTAGASSDIIAASVTAISSNTFTVTATWSNTTAGTIAISELGLEVTMATFVFLMTHDVFTGQNVSASGTAAATLTFTFT